jgi:hypothetical protein
MKHWQVQGSMPLAMRPGRSYEYRENVTAHVIAASARRAVELVELKHAGIEIHSVNHRGQIDVIDDSKSIDA